jgi:HD-GYP domain-containing protein (c-di-GMP phosphodiesterase class II)
VVVSLRRGRVPSFQRLHVMRYKTPTAKLRSVPPPGPSQRTSDSGDRPSSATGAAFPVVGPDRAVAATPRSVRAYVALLAVAAVFVAAVMSRAWPGISDRQLASALALGAFILAAELLNYRKPAGGNGSVAHIPLLALALVMPAWPAMLIAALPILVFAATQKRPAVRAIFNAAQAALAVGTSAAVFRILGGNALDLLPRGALLQPTVAAAALAADATFVLVNTTAVSAVLALTSGQPFGRVWSRSTLGTLVYYFFCAPFAGGLAWLIVHAGVVGAAAIALPMLGVRQLYLMTFQLARTTQELLELMVSALEARDTYTSGHSRRVARMAVVIARAAGLSGRAVERIHVAGLLHDVGKIHEKYAAILQKPDRLTDDEWRLMQQHPGDGEALVRKVSQLHDVLPGVRHHHEKWDGTGYPDRLQGEAIPLMARILAVADTIDAMTSDRPYRRGLTAVEVYEELRKWSGRQFDPAIVDRLLDSPYWDQLFEGSDLGEGRAPLTLLKPETTPDSRSRIPVAVEPAIAR